MKKLTLLVFAALLGAMIALGGYKFLMENQHQEQELIRTLSKGDSEDSITRLLNENKEEQNSLTNLVSHRDGYAAAKIPDFTEAAEKTVSAVVHVKNMEVRDAPRNISEYLRGIRAGKVVRGMGSGVIITPDGYVVTNNHVIEGASELEVILSDNRVYKAKVIGADEREDIALMKIDAKDLDYLPFGDSNTTKIGQWVLAVGNPFNLTSTVTAGIISAKGRNLSEGGTRLQSFIQTDAAVNPGNSGGALVNTKGELIGINAAISSRTGSYIGYSFAIPSNNARKIVEDLMEFGNVKHAILGISGGTVDPQKAKELGYSFSQGVFVAEVSEGAEKAGLESGDLITDVDGMKMRMMSDLTAYIGTKRPGDHVEVGFLRDKKEKTAKVKLTEFDMYVLEVADLELINAEEDYLKQFKTRNGVRIAQATSRNIQIPKDQYVIVAIDNFPVSSVGDVRQIVKNKNAYDRTKITFQNREGQRETLSF